MKGQMAHTTARAVMWHIGTLVRTTGGRKDRALGVHFHMSRPVEAEIR
jgi:hypothetical protein